MSAARIALLVLAIESQSFPGPDWVRGIICGIAVGAFIAVMEVRS